MRAHATHLFNLNDQRFQKHFSFMFAVFNVLQRHDLCRNAHFKLSRSSFNEFSSDFASISSDAINRLAAKACNTSSIIPEDEEEKRVMQLLNKVSMISSSVQGSSYSKLKCQNET